MARLQAPATMNTPNRGTSEAAGIWLLIAVRVTAVVLGWLVLLAAMPTLAEWVVRW